MDNNTPPTPPEVQQIQTDINLSDLKILRELVEACAARGIIQPKDFVLIGNVYQKLTKLP